MVVRIYDAATHTLVRRLAGHGNKVTRVRVRVRVGVTVRVGALLNSPVPCLGPDAVCVRVRLEVTDLAFSPDARWVVTSSMDGTVRYLNLKHP